MVTLEARDLEKYLLIDHPICKGRFVYEMTYDELPVESREHIKEVSYKTYDGRTIPLSMEVALDKEGGNVLAIWLINWEENIIICLKPNFNKIYAFVNKLLKM